MSTRRNYREQSYNLKAWKGSAFNKSKNGKPRSVPTWEQRLCFVVGSLPWKRFLEAKKYADGFDKIMQWDDSATEKAFHNAKSRYWVKISGLLCKIPLPSPDIYIDKIDWNTKIDPELWKGLEVVRDEVEEKHEEENVEVDNSYPLIVLDQPIESTGWDVSYSDL